MTHLPQLTLVSPSRALVVPRTMDTIDSVRLARIVSHLTELGWSVREAANTRALFKRFAGTDSDRTRILEEVLTDESTDLALALRGGYGAVRLLDGLHWERLAEKTVPLAGFSDITALSLAFLARLGHGSWLAPCANAFDVQCDARDRAFVSAFRSRTFSLRTQARPCPRPNPEHFSASGIFWGGNLSVLVNLIGTPYFPDVKGGILFLEDVAEPAYRIERSFMQLLLSGVFSRQKAIVCGDFTGADAAPGLGAGRYVLADALEAISRRTRVPVLTGFPIGHIASCATLPMGVVGSVTWEDGMWDVRADVSDILPCHAPGRI